MVAVGEGVLMKGNAGKHVFASLPLPFQVLCVFTSGAGDESNAQNLRFRRIPDNYDLKQE